MYNVKQIKNGVSCKLKILIHEIPVLGLCITYCFFFGFKIIEVL